MSNKKDLKAYVRYDGNGRVISSSLILNRFEPGVGNWQQVDAYECCNPTPTVPTVELSFTPETTAIGNISVQFLCDDSYVTSGVTSTNSLDMTTLLLYLNSSFPTNQFGTYSEGPEGSVILTMPTSIAQIICPTGTLTYTIYSD